MRPPHGVISLCATAILALLLPVSDAVLPALALPALTPGAATAIASLSTLALVKEALLLAELSSGRYRRYGSKNNNRYYRRRHRRAVGGYSTEDNSVTGLQ